MDTRQKGRKTYRQFEEPKDFLGIEEVIENSEGSDETRELEKIREIGSSPEIKNIANAGEVGTGDIEDVDFISQQECNVIDGGSIDWMKSRESEKSKMRPYIAGAIMTLWIGWTIIGLVAFALTGNPSVLLIGSSTSAGAGFALYKLANTVIKYYFS